MADQVLNTEVTEYMKGLTQAKVQEIIADIQDLFENYYQPGFQALKTAVNADDNTEWKNAFKQTLNRSNSQFFELSSEINTTTSLEEGVPYLPLKTSARASTQTRDKIKNIYKTYFKPIKDAGKGNERTNPRNSKKITGPEYPVMSAGILSFGKEVYPQSMAPPPNRRNYYQNLSTLDAYSAKAQTDYLFRYLFDKESFNEPDVETYIANYRSRFSDIDGIIDPGSVLTEINDIGIIVNRLYYSTIAGFAAALRAIKEKLENFSAIEKNFKSTPENSITEGANTTFLEEQLNTVLLKWSITFDLDSYIRTKLPESVFAVDDQGNYKNSSKIESIKKGFYNLFIPSGAASIPTNEKYGKNIWDKIRTSGLLDLAVSAGSIAEFAQKRFSVGEGLLDPVTGSAKNALDPARDTMWLNDLSRVMTTLTRDPITLSIIQNYFPNLVTLFFNATAAAADYSGGSSDDPLNNVEALAKSLIDSFGLDKDGNPVFEAAWDFINTGQRIQEALKQFPFRENITPKTPDLFHLRLGASNFYVPPVAISINSQFKTGSLTGGAIRQKSSPKFNAGYKETSINLKLFFPNYEEIWGISIDGIRDVTIDKDFKIDFKQAGNEEQIDKFLSSLRGLVAAFKYAPILPIKNVYLNSVHGITGVALSSMSISTIPNYPFALVVDLELLSFNHKPFLPMIKDFNQAIHWGKFRHYMGKAAGSLHSYINESFFLGKEEIESITNLPGDRADELIQLREKAGEDYGNIVEPDLLRDPFKNDIFNTNIIKEWRNGNNISLYIPERTQTKIFTPDTSSFRGEEEKLLEDTGASFWESTLKSIGIDINESGSYGRSLDSVVQTSIEGSISPSARRIVLESIDIILAGKNRKEFNEKAYDFYAKSFVFQNKNLLNQAEINYILAKPGSLPSGDYTSNSVNYYYNGKPLEKKNSSGFSDNYSLKKIRDLFEESSTGVAAFLKNLSLRDAQEKASTTGKKMEDFEEQSKEDIARAFNVLFYNRYFKSGPIQKLMDAKRLASANYQFNEWEVPMMRVDLDPKAVIVNGVSLTLGNNLAKMQLQMQDEPTYQHIGGKDTYMNISMTVFGEKELIKLRKVFEHINGLARLEHSTGVIGFMGIKNIIAGLAGMKYVMPLTYQVDTIPNYPHVYDVRVSFVDFDIFQQQKEKLSSKQQADMVKTFGTKKNPFLRIKQLWGSFNAYPDFPLMVKNSDGETVGTLDPDYYFRSFEMFDDDVIYHLQSEEKKLENFTVSPKGLDSQSTKSNQARNNKIINDIKDLIINNDTAALKNYFNERQITLMEASAYVEAAVREFLKGQKSNLLSDFIEEYPEVDGEAVKLSVERTVGSEGIKYQTKVGDIKYSADNAIGEIQKLLGSTQSSSSNEEFLSINTEELDIHHTITLIPASESVSDDKLPAILYHANGYHLGYVGKYDNRFYFTSDGVQLTKGNSSDSNDGKIEYTPVSIPFGDTDSPSKSYAARDSNGKEMGAAHITSLGGTGSNLARTHDPYTKSDPNTSEVTSASSTEGSVAKHWERMLIDTKYRDISGRMIRAFPTYMLWLIDEGGFVSGVKVFDNFYGLQSVIDFSIVQSEDILGDTLMLRVSNMYSKLTTAESSAIFRVDEEYNDQPTNAVEGIESVLDRVLNRARFAAAHMQNDYIVDINNIRLKPGVRVHLRGGYGSNPNALQTLFNGVITQVENGEIVTITAQSDAIELSPIVNSTNKKGDSGKIDGGINTGFWLSEPRDLMVRLLSMGTSRFREGFAHATRGRVFSENKFGIRHFGTILYEPLNDIEKAKNEAVLSSVNDAYISLGEGSGNMWGAGSALGILSSGTNEGSGTFGLGPEIRPVGASLMTTLWSNFSAQRDFEIFKRNIYPGNGTGIAQFLGGDLGDGWASVASLTPDEKTNERINYIGRVSDYSWNKLTAQYSQSYSPSGADAKSLIDTNSSANQINNSNGSADVGRAMIGGAIAAAGIAITGGLGAPIIGGALALTGLGGVLSGRAGTHIMNTLGITSGMDDDLPGLDEVSFRAQTYMRSVWDLFQMCARLLPNYIVAIRPFEDRSTVFYGKPHWLYTSGVVPLTTGFPVRSKAKELGIIGPAEIDVDDFLAKTMEALNRESSPLADAAAFSAGNSSLVSIQDLIGQQLNPNAEGSVYLPSSGDSSGNFRGKIIPFGYKSTMEFRGSNGNTVARLPESMGYATIGYHLPIGGSSSEVELNEDQLSNHKQIPQLPYRYRFPFFTERKDNIRLEDFAYYALADELGTWGSYKSDYQTLALDKWSYNGGGGKKIQTNWVTLLKKESQLIGANKTTDSSNLENRNNLKIGIAMEMGNLPIFSADSSISGDAYIFSERLNGQSSSRMIRMPLPEQGVTFEAGKAAVDYEIFKNYQSASNAASLQEWTPPAEPIEEQFYIAMRWPYNPLSGNDSEPTTTTVEQFKTLYNITDPVGNVKDYQNRKVMVYSPSTGKAVVCKPAYFMWGKNTVRAPGQKDGSRDEFGNSTRIDVDNGRKRK
jgi:hypothetical protein